MQTNAVQLRGARRGMVVAAATALTFVAVFVQALAGPLPAFACSCMAPMPTIAEVAQDPGTVIVAGVVQQQFPERTAVVVDTWFVGAQPVDTVWLGFGSQMMSSCDPFVTMGERRLLVMSRQAADLFTVNPCVQSGVIGTPAGDEALAAAVELFGGSTPPTPAPTEPPESPPPAPTGLDPSWLYVAAVVGGAGLIFVVVTLLAIRRRPTG
jgi:hypothetical protein